MISVVTAEVGDVAVDDEWNLSDSAEYLMHTIHAYPAKFPAFIASKAFDYAQQEGVDVKKVADVFCGCGTVALEAKLHGKNFWGCDINPVATLIAKTKSESYAGEALDSYYEEIETSVEEIEVPPGAYAASSERLRYWFAETSFNVLYGLRQAIEDKVPRGKYQDAFLCLFSSILKASSRWLTKSIKPQIDPNKSDIDIFEAFSTQYRKLVRSVVQIQEHATAECKVEIENCNFLKIDRLPKVDLIISSPPYVTSYEYADLHQLSALWLGYADDYRDLRKGSIGSVYNSIGFSLDLDSLNAVGRVVVENLLNNKKATAQVRSVGRYYLDMQRAIHRCSCMLNNAGMVFFVVGDTEYGGVKVRNSDHLVQCLMDEGFADIKAAKRRISNKLLTPYRDSIGRFSSDKSQRTVYHEEYVISGRMWRQ